MIQRASLARFRANDILLKLHRDDFVIQTSARGDFRALSRTSFEATTASRLIDNSTINETPTMNSLEDRLDRIEHKLDALLAAVKRGSGASPTTQPDIDVDIDGPRGDPEVRFVPKRWTGADFKGQKFSACDPAFLDMLAEAYEWFAQRDDESNAVDKNGAPKSKWSRLDASRARAWSARLRGGESVPPRPRVTAAPAPRPAATASSEPSYQPPSEYGSAQDDDIPF
jgi:hypothetical protein